MPPAPATLIDNFEQAFRETRSAVSEVLYLVEDIIDPEDEHDPLHEALPRAISELTAALNATNARWGDLKERIGGDA